MKIRNILFFILFFVVVFFSTGIIYINSQELVIEGKRVEYTLPYPGMLPDNPLYILKTTRDWIVNLLTKDSVSKSRLYLLNSDKRAASALALAENGKTQLAISTMSKAEKYALKLIKCMKDIKEKGDQKSDDFNLNVKLSNEKHREIIEDMLKIVPQGERHELEEVLHLNKQIQEELSKI